jgi:hypothetical protein
MGRRLLLVFWVPVEVLAQQRADFAAEASFVCGSGPLEAGAELAVEDDTDRRLFRRFNHLSW